ncbi:collagen alpha-6(VI) chain-like [Pangshura tecta]
MKQEGWRHQCHTGLKLGTFIHNMKMLLTLFLFLIGSQTSVTQMPAPTSADIVLLVDSSNSLGNKAFPSMKSFIIKMINHLTAIPNQYRIALAQYSDDLHVEFQLDTYKAKNPMLNHVKKNVVFKGGSVKTGNALRKVHETYFKGPTSGRDKDRILVVLTSGESKDAVGEPARILKSDGVKIIALGIQDVSPQELQSMATPQFSYAFHTVRDLSMSSQNVTKIIEDVIQTDINDIIPTVKTISVPGREVCKSDSVADVVFIVDEGVSKPNSEDIKNFLQDTVSFLDVKKDCTKIGLVTYSSEPHVLALLNEETNRTAILQKIQGFSLKEGKANTGAAIKATRKNIFSVKYGSRKAQGIEQIAILITHRPSEDNGLSFEEEILVIYLTVTGALQDVWYRSVFHYPASFHSASDPFLGLFMVEKELERWSVHVVPYALDLEHKEVMGRDVDQEILLSKSLLV